MRDSRYCEVTPLYLTPEGISSDTWNSSGLNDCPAADWDALDFDTIREELGAILVRQKDSRYWLFDSGVHTDQTFYHQLVVFHTGSTARVGAGFHRRGVGADVSRSSPFVYLGKELEFHTRYSRSFLVRHAHN